MTFYIIIAIIILIVVYFLSIYNKLKRLDNRVKEAFSTMDIYLKKRWDLIPNIVETVKGYSKYEKDTLEEIVKLRNGSYDNLNNKEKINTNEKVSNELNKIIALAESYPDLKANENYSELIKALYKIEDEIANSRKYYNGTVRIFNNKVEMFPSNIISKLLGYTSKTMFEASKEERQNVNIKL